MRESFRKNKVGMLLMLLSSIGVCFGQLMWKLSFGNGFSWLLMGFVFYGIGAAVMLFAYKFGSLSVLQPMLGFNYVFSTILGAVILNEEFTLVKLIAIFIIILGVVFIAGSDD
jgi:drug/metabolite transporter (DMT)-like permease